MGTEEIAMNALLLSREEVSLIAKRLYAEGIRDIVETDENIGKLIVIDVETGDYEVDTSNRKTAAEGSVAVAHLRAKHPGGRLVALRIGYNVAASFGGLMERTKKP